MKIKIIDLLNKIVNGEEVPKKIKYKDSIYIRDENYSDLYIKQIEIVNGEKIPNKYYYHRGVFNFMANINTSSALLDEVTIIEENNKEEIKPLETAIYTFDVPNKQNIEKALRNLSTIVLELRGKTDEIIKKVNKMQK